MSRMNVLCSLHQTFINKLARDEIFCTRKWTIYFQFHLSCVVSPQHSKRKTYVERTLFREEANKAFPEDINVHLCQNQATMQDISMPSNPSNTTDFGISSAPHSALLVGISEYVSQLHISRACVSVPYKIRVVYLCVGDLWTKP